MSSANERTITAVKMPAAQEAASHQIYQIRANPKKKANPPMIKPGPSSWEFRYRDSGPAVCSDAFLLHVHESVDVVHDGNSCKVVDGGGEEEAHSKVRPSYGSPVESEAVLALPEADNQLNDQKKGADHDQWRCPRRLRAARDARPGSVMPHSAGHAHQTKQIQGARSQVEADQPKKRPFAQFFVEAKTGHLREPVHISGNNSEQRPAYQHGVEVCDHKKAVVEHVIGRGIPSSTPAPAGGEAHDEPRVQYIGAVSLTRPRYMVKSQSKILTPVGTAMIMVVMPKNALTSGLAPIVKKWCSQTKRKGP